MYRGNADWDIVKIVKEVSQYPICGSGDIYSWETAINMQRKTKCDGIMVGRGTLGKPWIFDEIKKKENIEHSLEDIKSIVVNLSVEIDKIWGDKGIIELRKQYAWFFRGLPDAKNIRTELMSATSLKEVKNILG